MKYYIDACIWFLAPFILFITVLMILMWEIHSVRECRKQFVNLPVEKIQAICK